MKRVGILTFHRASNYGAVLQAYALKTKIEELGHYAEIIDYRNDAIEQMYDCNRYWKLGGIKNKIRHIRYKRSLNKINEAFELFRKKYLNLDNSRVYSKADIREAVKSFDVIVVGSDQVWNPEAHGFDKNYFLEFVDDNSKKYSYAASFGGNQIDSKYLDDIKSLLSSFSICSVREEQGEALISGIIDTKTRLDLDPVLLLSKEEWRNSFDVKPSCEEYVLIYSLSFTDHQKNIAIKLHNMGYSIKMIGKLRRNPFPFDCEFIQTTSPELFVNLLGNASCIITNSFHGTAFSLIFNKPMYVELYEGNSSKVNARLINITNLFGISNRIINQFEEDAILKNDINWTYINSKIDYLREKSVKYINEVILDE